MLLLPRLVGPLGVAFELVRVEVTSRSGGRPEPPVVGRGRHGEAHVGYFRDGRVMGPLAEGLGLTTSGRLGNSGPSWLIRRLVDIVVPVATVVLVVSARR